MPLNNGKPPPRCINHPSKDMLLNNDGISNAIHTFSLALCHEKNGDVTYEHIARASGINLYACPICGYCESYLVQAEIEQLNES